MAAQGAPRMRLALGQFSQLADEKLLFAKQLGVDEVLLNWSGNSAEPRFEFRELLLLRSQCEDAGVKLVAIESIPARYYDKAMLGLPGRDEQIEHYQRFIRNLGRAGIHILGYHWAPDLVWRTSSTTPDRGGARVTSFDYDLVKDAPLTFGREYTEEEMWDNYAYFARAVVPVAEEAGVRLALHPADPPVASIGGMPRLFRSFAAFQRALEIAPGPGNGLLFCQGCWSEMGTDVLAAIRHFASRDAIVYVHFRSVKGAVPKFQETFIGQGDLDMLQALKTYKEAGFRGFLIDDHVPHMVDDTPWGHRARAHAIGYMAALLEVVNSQD